MTRRSVYLHIGAPKTGTTYVQDRLTRNAASLASHGVLLPTANRFVPADLFHFRAALDVLGQDWGGAPGHADGAWGTMVKRVRRSSGTVVISHEIFAPAAADRVARIVADLTRDGDTELHIVYSARDLGRQLPAAWQESVKQGRKWSFARFLDRVEKGTTWFVKAFDLPTVLGRWGAGLPPGNVHVVTVPQRDALKRDKDLLWRRMCESFAIDPAWAPETTRRTNTSLGIPETQLLRELNRRMQRAVRREAAFDELVREMLAHDKLMGRKTLPVRLAPDRFDWAEQQTEGWLDWLKGSGVDLIGDLDDLRPVRPPAGETWINPDQVRPKQAFHAAVEALAAMTAEAARRPDPDRQGLARLRSRAEQLRGR